ncbi:hypothetical protein L1D14_23020 [Vibrio tubiashii]|uniref:hypothetical protein n=1 Tax=Vibrio tubiashii TaxID=29498 RepID=UPI001EFD103C|nr:hypothetical protein [Vibrio tubiashii]MCG9579077.1 hypothetical protein [Vibrio tubiashii]
MNILEIDGRDGWVYYFRKLPSRQIEIKKSHRDLGDLGSWQIAKNLYLQALISDIDLAEYFGMTAWQFRYGSS